MKNLPILFLSFLLSCNYQQKSSSITKSDAVASIHNLKDTSIVILETLNGIRYTADSLRKIELLFPALTDLPTDNPDISYNSLLYSNKNAGAYFGGETGQDAYCILYAYFLKKRNGEKIYAARRKQLTDIYRAINEINRDLTGGGTYYGHQGYRIAAYVEYSVYRYKEDSSNFIKDYFLSNQKSLFNNSLRLYVKDKIDNDNGNGLSPNDKLQKKTRLLAKVSGLNELITDYFYLDMARKFHYTYYY